MSRRLAVLIDGENICGDFAADLFASVSELGDAVVRRIYGNFTNSQAKTWLSPMKQHGIIAQQICSAKNAADIALTIDAMELLVSDRIDGFCIVSSDKGLALVAAHIRERNVQVFGYCRDSALDDVKGSFTKIFQLPPGVVKDSETTELLKAVESHAVDGWALLSALGTVIDHKKYKRRSLSKLFEGNPRFELETKHKRVRIVR